MERTAHMNSRKEEQGQISVVPQLTTEITQHDYNQVCNATIVAAIYKREPQS
jgi:hypothetical protein